MNILDELREGTRVDHETIEDSLGLMAANLSRTQYVGMLERFYGYYEPLEYRLWEIAGMRDVLDDLDQRRKVPLLKRDLDHWDCNEQAQPRCSRLPAVDDVIDAFGCCNSGARRNSDESYCSSF